MKPLFPKLTVLALVLISQSSYAIFNKIPIFNRCFYTSKMESALPDKKIVLTFDDGPNDQTVRLLEILKNHDVKASFFVLGSKVKKRPEIVRQAWEEGHIIANHSYSHADFHGMYESGVRSEILRTDAILKPYMKEKFFRYPHGNSTCAAEKALNQNNYLQVGWQVDTCDYAYSNGTISAGEASACEISQEHKNDLKGHVLKLIERKKGGIVLFHDIHASTVDIIEPLIIELKERGYQFVNLDDSDVLHSLKTYERAK